MQETEYKDERQSKRLQEFFSVTQGEDWNNILTEKMNSRLEVLKERGHTLVKREKVGRNQLCPCGSGKKFKKCCIFKVDKME